MSATLFTRCGREYALVLSNAEVGIALVFPTIYSLEYETISGMIQR